MGRGGLRPPVTRAPPSPGAGASGPGTWRAGKRVVQTGTHGTGPSLRRQDKRPASPWGHRPCGGRRAAGTGAGAGGGCEHPRGGTATAPETGREVKGPLGADGRGEPRGKERAGTGGSGDGAPRGRRERGARRRDARGWRPEAGGEGTEGAGAPPPSLAPPPGTGGRGQGRACSAGGSGAGGGRVRRAGGGSRGGRPGGRGDRDGRLLGGQRRGAEAHLRGEPAPPPRPSEHLLPFSCHPVHSPALHPHQEEATTVRIFFSMRKSNWKAQVCCHCHREMRTMGPLCGGGRGPPAPSAWGRRAPPAEREKRGREEPVGRGQGSI